MFVYIIFLYNQRPVSIMKKFGELQVFDFRESGTKETIRISLNFCFHYFSI